MRKEIIAIVLGLTCISSVAEDVVYGIDLHQVDWPLLCARVGPVTFNQGGLSCPVSHPASKYHNSVVAATIAQRLPQYFTCQNIENEYRQLTQPRVDDGVGGMEWEHCYLVFKSALIDRTRNPDRYNVNTPQWVEAHFNEQTMVTTYEDN